jgi:hypothetical protein
MGSILATTPLLACCGILSSTAGRTLFNFDVALRCCCAEEGGWDCLRLTVEAGGDTERGGVEEVGGVEEGDDMSDHCGPASEVGKYSPL